MDTTKKNILMCEKAVEVQKLRPRPGSDDIPNIHVSGTPNIWLPRQDQLQGMVIDLPRIKNFNGLLPEIYQFACNTTIAIKNNVNPDWSMEQLWLAFVMKEKFKKIWDGKDWIKPL